MGPGEKLVRAAVRRPLAFFAAFALLALLAGAAESGLAVLRSKSSEPGLGARWIWAEGAARSGNPLTFYAARDFELPENVEKAWLSIAADESYVLWVNGRAAGSGGFREDQDGGQAADLYEISDRLERGANRLVVELRSSSGAGGLLANLRLGEQGRPALDTLGDWRIFRRADPRLLRGLARLDQLGGENPRLWHWPPTGRWRTGRLAPRPDLAAPDPLRPGGLCPQRLRFPGAGSAWSELPASPSCAVPGVSEQNLWDFGGAVEGFLEMGLPPQAEPRPALVYFLDREPDERLVEMRPEVLQPAPGAWLWRDTAARRFRYVVVIGIAPSGFMRLLPASENQKTAYSPPPPPRGVFGLAAPSGPNALEAAVWQRYLDPE